MRRLDLSGQKFGRLTAIEIAFSKNKRIYWLCQCKCGKLTFVERGNLKSGHTKSCGCLQIEKGCAPNHHLRYHRLYNIWSLMKKRCINSSDKLYKYYGGRGITVCEEWRNDFKAFYDWAMANGYKEDLTLDRIDVNGNYKPSNCRWASSKLQKRNMRNNKFVTYKGVTHCLSEWAELYNISYRTFWKRLKKGWTFEKALLTPVDLKRRNKRAK